MTKVTDINDLQKSWEVTDTKDFNELQKYSDAQFKVVVDLQKKNHELQEQIKSLQTMLESNLPRIEVGTNDLGIPNELLICETQLFLLKEHAMTRELTMEEARKVQIYTDVLEKVKKKPKDNSAVENMGDEDLLRIVQINGTN